MIAFTNKNKISKLLVIISSLLLFIVMYNFMTRKNYKPQEIALKNHIEKLLNMTTDSDSLSSISIEDRNTLEQLYDNLVKVSGKTTFPWLKDGWEVLERLNPRGGWIDLLEKEEHQANVDYERCQWAEKQLADNGHKCNIIIINQFESLNGMGNWEIGIGDKTTQYQGSAILMGPENLVGKLINMSNGQMIIDIILFPKGAKTVGIGPADLGYSTGAATFPLYSLPALGVNNNYISLQSLAEAKWYAFTERSRTKNNLINAKIHVKAAAEQALQKSLKVDGVNSTKNIRPENLYHTIIDFRLKHTYVPVPTLDADKKILEIHWSKNGIDSSYIQLMAKTEGPFTEKARNQILYLVQKNNQNGSHGEYYLILKDGDSIKEFSCSPAYSLTSRDLDRDGYSEIVLVGGSLHQGTSSDFASIVCLKNNRLSIIKEKLAWMECDKSIEPESRTYIRADQAVFRFGSNGLEFKVIPWIKWNGWNEFKPFDEETFKKEQALRANSK